MLEGVCDYGKCIVVDISPARAVEVAKTALKDEGFGVLCEIDVAKTLKEKIGADVAFYVILGACNPKLAHEALGQEPNLGLLLPCNVIVRESKEGTVIGAIDAQKMMEVVANPLVEPVALDANLRLGRVLDKLQAVQ